MIRKNVYFIIIIFLWDNNQNVDNGFDFKVINDFHTVCVHNHNNLPFMTLIIQHKITKFVAFKIRKLYVYLIFFLFLVCFSFHSICMHTVCTVHSL